jgi:hypothetical protein
MSDPRFGRDATQYDAFLSAQESASASVVGGETIALVSFAPRGETWEITSVKVKASTAVLEATAFTYRNLVGDNYILDTTFAGSSGDTSDTPITLRDGDRLWVRWTGGDLGATYSAVVNGWRSTPQGGFRGRRV